MRVGIDGRYAEGKLAGIGKYIKYLSIGLSRLEVGCTIFYSRQPEIKIQGRGIKSVILKSSNRYFFEQVLLPKALKKERVDLYHATSNTGVPLFCSFPAVLTIHDIIPLEFKNYFDSSKLPFLSRFLYIFRLKISLFKAKRIIVISEYTKRALISKFGIEEDKVKVIRSGISGVKASGKLPAGIEKEKYILNHGGIDIRKNLERLIRAFAKFHSKFPDLKLVITGENQLLRRNLNVSAETLKIKDNIVFIGYVDEPTLWSLIKFSSCICYPTLVEGFGFPVLEGFVAGVPVISSKSTSILEIASDAALLINPKSESEIISALFTVLTDKVLAKKMTIKGKEEAKKYNWRKTALNTLGIYKEALL